MIGPTQLVTGLSYKFAAMLSISFLQVVGLVFVFLLGRLVFSAKTGLLAALLLGLGAEWIPLGTGIIPNGTALIIVVTLTYMVFAAKEKQPLIFTFLILLASGVVILTHTVGALSMAILLFSFWVGFELHKRLYRAKSDSTMTLSLAILVAVAMFAWWTYAAGKISTLADLIRWGFKVEQWAPAQQSIEYVHTVPYSEHVLTILGFLLFYAFSIIGSFYLLAKKFGNERSFALVLGGLVLVAIGFFSLPFGLSGTLPHRWWFASYPIMAIPAAVGFMLICARFKRSSVRIAALAIPIFVISFFSITAPTANFDNRIYSENTAPRDAFTESEIRAMDTISDLWDGRVGVATPEARYYLSYVRDRIVKETAGNLYYRDFSDCRGTIVIITDEIVNNVFSIGGTLGGGYMKLDYDPREVLDEQRFNRIYDCGSTYAYR
jgi:hypothetical protein